MTESMREALKNLLSWAEREVCTHEETYRGGVLWEICSACGAKWADDEGGKPEFEWPTEIIAAQEALAQPQQWIKCSDREPSDMDADWRGHVYAFSEGVVSMKHWMDVVGAGYSHWMPTNLNRPEPPKE